MVKIDFIKEYIKNCEEVINLNDAKKAEQLQIEIVSLFENDIPRIKDNLENYGFDIEERVDFIKDIKLLKLKLEKYCIDIETSEIEKNHQLEMLRLKQPSIIANAQSSANQSTNIDICLELTLQQTLDSVNECSNETLNEKEKEAISDLLIAIEGLQSTNDKHKIWEKAKEVLKYVVEKGVDVGIVLLPYIISRIS